MVSTWMLRHPHGRISSSPRRDALPLSQLPTPNSLNAIPQPATLAQCLNSPQASYFTFYWSSSILTHSHTFLVDTLELHVRSPASIDKECAYSKAIGSGPPSDDSDSDYSDHNSLWEVSSVSSVKSSRYDVSKLEAHLYYYGIRGPRRLGPKLIFRTSKDIFTAPSRPQHDSRLIRLLQASDH